MAVFLNILDEEARPGPAGELTLRGTGEREAEYRRIKSRRQEMLPAPTPPGHRWRWRGRWGCAGVLCF